MTNIVEITASKLEVRTGTHCDNCEAMLPFDCQDLAQAAITALHDAGFVIVPLEPTMEMSDAGFCTLDGQADCSCSADRAYRAMINAGKGE